MKETTEIKEPVEAVETVLFLGEGKIGLPFHGYGGHMR